MQVFTWPRVYVLAIALMCVAFAASLWVDYRVRNDPIARLEVHKVWKSCPADTYIRGDGACIKPGVNTTSPMVTIDMPSTAAPALSIDGPTRDGNLFLYDGAPKGNTLVIGGAAASGDVLSLPFVVDKGLIVGAPTGGALGARTINVARGQKVFVNGEPAMTEAEWRLHFACKK